VSEHRDRSKERQISVTRRTYDRIVAGLPRTHRGAVRPGAMQKRADDLINRALDEEIARAVASARKKASQP